MQLAQSPRLDDEQRAGHGRRDRELGLRHGAHRAARELIWLLREQFVAMRQRRLVQRTRRRLLGKGWRHRPGGDIDLLLGEIGESLGRQIEGLGQHLGRRVAEPVGDRERAELREIAVVETPARRCTCRGRAPGSNGPARAGTTTRRPDRTRRPRTDFAGRWW
jgi:hypothetical protein